MVFHGQRHTTGTLVKDVSKIYNRRSKSHCINSKDCLNKKLHREYLGSTRYSNGYSHCEFFIFILRGKIIILLNKVLPAVGEYRAIRSELEPDLKGTLTLDVTEGWVKLQVGLKGAGVEELNFHGLGRTVEKY